MDHVPAVVVPGNRMGLDIARSLGRRGVPVYGIDPDPQALSGKSKYCHLVASPDPEKSTEEYLRFLVDWGRNRGGKAVLYPLNDDMVLLCSRERSRLQPYYRYVMPDHTTLSGLSSKEGLANAAQEWGIPTPKTVFPENAQVVEAIAPTLSYPVILKPIHSAYWHAPEIASMLRENVLSGQAKVRLCHDAAELVHAYNAIAAYDDRLLIQEVIPGPDGNLVYICFYMDRQSQPLALFAGRKPRTLPVGFGPASFARSYHDPDLEHLALKLLSGVKYQGLGGLEFKRDSRDGAYKLVEFNTRFGLWDGLGTRCGVDIAYIAYRDTLQLPVQPHLTYREDVNWVDLLRDLRAFWMYRRRGKLTFGQWLGSLRGEKMWGIYSWDDWRPGAAVTADSFRLWWNRITSRRS